MTDKVYYSHRDANNLYRTVLGHMHRAAYVPSVVIGLSRGGLDMGVKFSHYFGCEFVPLVWQTRDGESKDLDTLTHILNKYNNKNILIVDDICDTGQTLTEISGHIPQGTQVEFAVMIEKTSGDFACDWRGQWASTESDVWYVFPWENWHDNAR
jgi:hypoxanthine phosphoribosyltransferase